MRAPCGTLLRATCLVTVLLAGPAAGAGHAAAGPRPLVAVVASSAGTETTDFLVPLGVLSASGAVDVIALATEAGRVPLMPALAVEIGESLAAFDAQRPAGADVVVVPAVHDADDPTLVAWVRDQARRGAKIVAVCDGVWVATRARLLEGRTATGHWDSVDDLAAHFPRTRWVRDRRFVRDDGVWTTAGVTASLPASLALVEELAGRAAAERVASQPGIDGWSDAHDGASFALEARHVATIARNWLAFWRHETVPAAPGSARTRARRDARGARGERRRRDGARGRAAARVPVARRHGGADRGSCEGEDRRGSVSRILCPAETGRATVIPLGARLLAGSVRPYPGSTDGPPSPSLALLRTGFEKRRGSRARLVGSYPTFSP